MKQLVGITLLCLFVSQALPLYAASSSGGASSIFGTVKVCGGNTGIKCPPGGAGSDPRDTVLQILNTGLEVLLIIAALVTLVNLISAGFDYMDSTGDPKKVQSASNKLLYSFIGLAVIVLAPLIAGLLGQIIYGDWNAILKLGGSNINP